MFASLRVVLHVNNSLSGLIAVLLLGLAIMSLDNKAIHMNNFN